MPLSRLSVRSAVDSVSAKQSGPQTGYDTFADESASLYRVDPSTPGPGYADSEYGDNRTIASAGFEEFDLNSPSTPLLNKARESVAFARVMVARVHNTSAAANLAVNTGPNACDLPSKKVLAPGERVDYDATVNGAGTAITPGTASKFRVASDAADASYSIYFAGQQARALGSASFTVSTGMSAVPSISVFGSALLSASGSALGVPAIAGAGKATLAASASIPFAASTVAYPP